MNNTQKNKLKEKFHEIHEKGATEFGSKWMLTNDQLINLAITYDLDYRDEKVKTFLSVLAYRVLKGQSPGKSELKRRFKAIYCQFMNRPAITDRSVAHRYYGALEVLWCAITEYPGGDPLPYRSWQVPTWFGLSSKIKKESYPALILRLSEELYNELEENDTRTL